MTHKHRILIVDDHPIVRQGYAQLIGDHRDLEVCGFASTEQEALALCRERMPHLVIIDITLKEGHGIELIKQLVSRDVGVKILVISAHDEKIFAERALEAGALGYINKQEATDELIDGIRAVLAGDVYLSEQMSKRLLKRRVGNRKSNSVDVASFDQLTDRELEVFQLIGKGLTTRRIADQLQLSPKTIERYRENIKHKLNLANATELLQRATRWSLEGG
jgi:DNA-binding NarL/FixJ family response regulator